VTVMIGVDPHKGSHTAAAIDAAEVARGDVRVRAADGQLERLLEWAGQWPQRTWAVENASGLGYLLAQQLVAAGERVLDVPPKLGARVRLLATGDTNKNDPNDARSVAVAALRSPSVRAVAAEDHRAVMKLRQRDLRGGIQPALGEMGRPPLPGGHSSRLRPPACRPIHRTTLTPTTRTEVRFAHHGRHGPHRPRIHHQPDTQAIPALPGEDQPGRVRRPGPFPDRRQRMARGSRGLCGLAGGTRFVVSATPVRRHHESVL
jgi:hypothetical protein